MATFTITDVDEATAARLFEQIELISDQTLAARAFTLARERDHPAHDCFHPAAAERLQGIFVTADERLLKRISGTSVAPFARDLAHV
jgi:predicted nucleic acid-binding protein